MMVASTTVSANSRVDDSPVSFLVQSPVHLQEQPHKSSLPPCAIPDIYGQVHPVETDELISSSLRKFDLAVNLLRNDVVAVAERKCPHLLTPSFKLLFLRCEVFHVDRAAQRYANYWEQRLEAFGPDKAFLPLTLSEALRDDDIPLRRGSMQIIRRHGRRDLLYFDPSKLDKTQYSRESACRALWYWFHALLEDEEVQKRGVIILNYNANFSNRNRDPPLTKLCFKTLQGTLPVRVSAIHGCHVPLVYSCIISIFLVFMGERVRRRILAHNGTVDAVIQTLQNVYDIHADDIPIDMGGNLKLDVCAWLDERKAAGM